MLLSPYRAGTLDLLLSLYRALTLKCYSLYIGLERLICYSLYIRVEPLGELWDKVKRLMSFRQEHIFFEIKAWLGLEV